MGERKRESFTRSRKEEKRRSLQPIFKGDSSKMAISYKNKNTNKVVLGLALVGLMVMALVSPSAQNKEDCFCPCMRDKCMTIQDATREECAPACTEGCNQAGYQGQPNPKEFCGF